jgi:hypothetical protein
VYLATDFMPLVEQTRARTQELFQRALDRHNINSTIGIKSLLSKGTEGPRRYVENNLRWEKGLELGFDCFLNGERISALWPICFPLEDEDYITKEEIEQSEYSPEFIGVWRIVDDFTGIVPSTTLNAILTQDHYWNEYRSIGTHTIGSTGYGFVMDAVAEATDGILATFDGAFDLAHNGETAEQFLSWWEDQQFANYGLESFR